MDSDRSRSRSPPNRFDRDTRPGDAPPSEKLFLTFLPQGIDESQLRDVFEQMGTVTRVKIIAKDDGFTMAFLDMSRIEEAERAVQKLQRHKMGDKQIRVQFARERKRDDRNERGSRENTPERGFRGDFRKESDVRQRFQGEDRGRTEGRGRGRDGGFGDRPRGGGDYGDRGDRGGRDGGERRPMKCFKCQGEGHISKNCPGEDQGRYGDRGEDQGRYGERGERSNRKAAEKMSEDEFNDY